MGTSTDKTNYYKTLFISYLIANHKLRDFSGYFFQEKENGDFEKYLETTDPRYYVSSGFCWGITPNLNEWIDLDVKWRNYLRMIGKI